MGLGNHEELGEWRPVLSHVATQAYRGRRGHESWQRRDYLVSPLSYQKLNSHQVEDESRDGQFQVVVKDTRAGTPGQHVKDRRSSLGFTL